MHTGTIAFNVIMFYFLFEFLVTGWLWRMMNLRYVFNAQWRVNPMASIIQRGATAPLTTPKPDILVAIYRVIPAALPFLVVADSTLVSLVICDPNLQFSSVTIEINPFKNSPVDQPESSQCSHDAASVTFSMEKATMEVHLA